MSVLLNSDSSLTSKSACSIAAWSFAQISFKAASCPISSGFLEARISADQTSPKEPLPSAFAQRKW